MRGVAWLLTCVWASSVAAERIETSAADSRAVSPHVSVQIVEGIDVAEPWRAAKQPTATWQQDCFAWTRLPRKYARGGIIADRTNPFLLVGEAKRHFPAGTYDFLLRAKNLARLSIDGNVVLEHKKRLRKNADGHESVPELPQAIRIRTGESGDEAL